MIPLDWMAAKDTIRIVMTPQARADLTAVLNRALREGVDLTYEQTNGQRVLSESAVVRYAFRIAAQAPAAVSHDGARLQAARKRAGLSQSELAAELGIARATIANVEQGRAPMTRALRQWLEGQEHAST